MLTHIRSIVQDQFSEYMFSQAIKQDFKVLTENKSKFLLVRILISYNLQIFIRAGFNLYFEYVQIFTL